MNLKFKSGSLSIDSIEEFYVCSISVFKLLSSQTPSARWANTDTTETSSHVVQTANTVNMKVILAYLLAFDTTTCGLVRYRDTGTHTLHPLSVRLSVIHFLEDYVISALKSIVFHNLTSY